MNLAEKKKQSNISEYIIYMYQTEDLLRAFDLDIEQVEKYVISHIPESEENKTEILSWYNGVLSKMKEEGVEQSGHLAEVQNVVTSLESLKAELLSSDDNFKEVYDKAKPFIDENLKLAKGAITSEIQICLNGVYGLLLMRTRGLKVDDDLLKSLDTFGDVLSYLSYKYKQKHYTSEN